MASAYSAVPPPPFQHTQPAPVLIAQGAEAQVFRTVFLSSAHPSALKYRPSKAWRHPTLDARLTRHRILAEARILAKCRRDGIPVPAIYSLECGLNSTSADIQDENRGRGGGWILTEWIDGCSVRQALELWSRSRSRSTQSNTSGDAALIALLEQIGTVIGRMHHAGVIHGDLTTSNLMLQSPVQHPETENGDMSTSDQTVASVQTSLQGQVVIIDFGLASQTQHDEERAVDLYVLERAFGSTHPRLEDQFSYVLDAYGRSFKGATAVLRRLDGVRMRGRKKSMIG